MTWTSAEEWEEEGRFWLPGEPEGRCYGKLTFTPARGPEVHMMDSPLIAADGPTIGDVPALHGETLGGRPLSLLGGFLTNATESFGGPGTSGNVADALFASAVKGAHVSSENEVRGGEAHLSLQGLLEFLTGGKVEAGLLSVAAERGSHDQFEVTLPFGTLQLSAGAGGSFSRLRQSHTVAASAFVTFNDECTLPEIDARVGPLRDLVVFSTRERSFIDRLALFPPRTASDGVVDLEQIASELQICRAPNVERPTERTSSYYSLWLNPATVGDPGELISAWYELRERLGPVWALLFGTMLRPNLPLETRLLNLTAFAEGYHRTLHDEIPLAKNDAKAARKAMLAAVDDEHVREIFKNALAYANAQSQRERIRWMAERAVVVLEPWELDVREFCAQIADTRNWLTHWGERGKHTQEGMELVRLLARLDLVITANLMLDLGLDDGTVAAQIGSGIRLWDGLP